MGDFIYNHRFKDAVSDIEPKIDLVGDSEIVLATNDEKIVFKNKSGNLVTVSSDAYNAEQILDFFDGAEYDSNNKKIIFKHGDEVKAEIDASDFIKDGMIDTVKIEDGKLKIIFNTDSGKEEIDIELTDIFNPDNYYTKENVDALLAEKEEEITALNKANATLKDIVATIGGDVQWAVPGEGKLDDLLDMNGTVTLQEDTVSATYTGGVGSKNKTTLNLNGKNLTFSAQTTTNPCIMARNKQEFTIMGKGTFDAAGHIAVETYGTGTTINLSGTTGFFASEPTYVTDRSGGELIYCYSGTINIYAGIFRNNGEDKTFTLNCYDSNYRSGKAKIVVYGGKFYDFDPADNNAEGEHTNFLAEGYHTEASTVVEEGVEHTIYTVKKD